MSRLGEMWEVGLRNGLSIILASRFVTERLSKAQLITYTRRASFKVSLAGERPLRLAFLDSETSADSAQKPTISSIH